MSTTTKSVRNVAIEAWRFLMAFFITGYHIAFIIPKSATGANGFFLKPDTLFTGAGETLLVFTVTAGYFMVANFKKAKANGLTETTSPAALAWNYTWARVKSLLPVLILGYLLGIACSTAFIYPEYSMKDILTMSINSIWEFLGFHAVGLRSTGNQFFQLNGALWFISAIIVLGYFFYYGLAKNEDFTAGFVTPLLSIFFAGWWAFTGTRASQAAWSTFGAQTAATNNTGGNATAVTPVIGFNNGLLYVMIGLGIGIMSYYLVQKLKTVQLSGAKRALLTVYNVLVSVALVWYSVFPNSFLKLDRWTVAFLCISLVVTALWNEDGLTKVLNNKATQGLFSYLGQIALYLYMVHFPVAFGVMRVMGPNTQQTAYTFGQVFIPTVIISLVLSVLANEILKRTLLKK